MMFDDSESPSPVNALIALAAVDPEWRPILHLPNQVVLYNPTSHALSIHKHNDETVGLVRRHAGNRCPFCHHALPTETHPKQHDAEDDLELDAELELDGDEFVHARPRSRAANYFQLLQIANETASRPVSRQARTIPESIATARSGGSGSSTSGAFNENNMAEGYFKAFFKEEGRLGMGANGSVFLCQVRRFPSPFDAWSGSNLDTPCPLNSTCWTETHLDISP